MIIGFFLESTIDCFLISHFSHLKDIIRSTFSLSLWQTTIQLVSLFKFHCIKYIFMTKNNFLNTFYFSFMHSVLHPWKPTASLTISKHVQDWPWVSDDECFSVLHMSMNCLSQWMILFFVWTCSIPFFLVPNKSILNSAMWCNKNVLFI